ncbi:S8 family peptidase [Duganella callida]|uniref:Peptidase S8 and S53 subtilisin kexin sedolisin n=1 Tax=Duganella callida TaxID=2561932 RepID=A0A4Y9S7F1_9BURK|nr:S8 family peptidase [Duganella callida]TFW17197.1 peptidase S8 and S53 subtilisin kexin sedolisin [Duganella callida]
MRPRLLPLALLLAGVFAGHAVQANQAAQTAPAVQAARHTYIVQLSDKPAASYTGGVNGLAATKPPAGTLINPESVAVQNYLQYLQQRRSAVTAGLPAGALVHDFKLVYNGFVARLTDAEALALKHTDGVLAVRPDTYFAPATSYTPTYLGLDRPGGLWSQLGGKEHAGENIIIGVIDTGIWPENPSFADRVDANGAPTHDPSGTLVYDAPPARWRGFCQYGYGFNPGACNNKLIGARYYNFLKDEGMEQHWTEFDSPRDSTAGQYGKGGHGTHTASTAAGNNGVAANIAGAPVGQVSGMAPRARVAAYKICFTRAASDSPVGINGCSSTSAVAAIEQAVFDGVDVLSYSISGITDSVDEIVEQAFLGATNAGVFVSVAAGNAGPGNSVNHPSPWLTSVGASTTDRLSGAQALLSTGAKYVGASVNPTPLAAAPVILAENAGSIPYENLAGPDRDARRLCYTEADRITYGASSNGALDPALTAGKVVICQRGNSARVDKSKAVLEAGGVGMVLVDDGNGITIDPHAVPSVHVSVQDGAAIRAAVLAQPSLRIGISAFGLFPNPEGSPKMASFSSRGPNMALASILKPDLTAPGVNVLAGFAPDLTQEQHDAIQNGAAVTTVAWSYASGTSMATPHVSGLAALLKQRHPDWSPAAIKSALMTTATPTVDDGLPADFNGMNAFGQGAGHVAPTPAADPGLVYELGATDYQRFLCGIGSYNVAAEVCASVGSVKDYDLNLASLTAGNVPDTLTLKRRVTNVSATQSTYTASASVPGFTVSVSPASLTLAPGASAEYSVTLKRATAANNAWSFGQLEWSDGSHHVRSPLTARTSLFTAQPLYYSEGSSGNKTVGITPAFSGKLTVKAAGLREATQDTYTLAQNTSTDYGVAECAAGGNASVSYKRVTIPAGTVGARFSLYDEDTSGGSADDLNLLLLDGKGNLLYGSVSLYSSNEDLQTADPEPGDYIVCVVARSPVNGSATAKLSSWLIGSGPTSTGNLKVLAPSTVFAYRPASATYTWSGLTPGKHYMGGIEYSNGSLRLGATLIQVESFDTIWARTPGSYTYITGRQLPPGTR